MNIYVKTWMMALCLGAPLQGFAKDCVVLLHGLARTSASLEKLQTTLEDQGYLVVNKDYPSRQYDIPQLATLAIGAGVEQCETLGAEKIHFVTHSLGGILVRQYLSHNTLPKLGRVVMMGPPNKGSEVVDKLKNVPGFALINGPAGLQLGTGEQDIPGTLGPATFEVGIIAGTRSVNLILSTMIPEGDDGKVSVDSAHLVNETDFVSLPVTHPFMMKNPDVIAQVIHFLKNGKFIATEQNSPPNEMHRK